MRFIIFISTIVLACSCHQKITDSIPLNDYFNYGDSLGSGGVKLIPIKTPVGNFKVWTKRFGNNPRNKNSATAWRPRHDT